MIPIKIYELIEIFRIFIRNPAKFYSLNEIQTKLNVSYEPAYRYMKNFEAVGLITRIHEDNKHKFKLNLKNENCTKILGLLKVITGQEDLSDAQSIEPEKDINIDLFHKILHHCLQKSDKKCTLNEIKTLLDISYEPTHRYMNLLVNKGFFKKLDNKPTEFVLLENPRTQAVLTLLNILDKPKETIPKIVFEEHKKSETTRIMTDKLVMVGLIVVVIALTMVILPPLTGFQVAEIEKAGVPEASKDSIQASEGSKGSISQEEVSKTTPKEQAENITELLPEIIPNKTVPQLMIIDINGDLIDAEIELQQTSEPVFGIPEDNETFKTAEVMLYTLDVIPSDSPIEKIEFHDLEYINGTFGTLKLDDTPETGDSVETYAIDPTAMKFSDAEVTVTAKGNELYKCKDWKFDDRICLGDWVKIKEITPGQDYTFVLTPEDPAYSEQPGSEGKDAYIDSGTKTYNYGADTEIDVRGDDSRRVLIEFNLSSIPANASISSATLTMYATAKGSADAVVNISKITNSWVEGTGAGSKTSDGATWDNRSGTQLWTTAGGDYGTITWGSTTITGIDQFFTWNITELVKGWINGTYTNEGMLLRTTTTSSGTTSFASSDYANSSRRPQLNVTYTESQAPTINQVQMPSSIRVNESLDVTVNATDNDAVSSIKLELDGTNHSLSQSSTNSTQVMNVIPTTQGTIETDSVTNYKDTYDQNNATYGLITDDNKKLMVATPGIDEVGTVNSVKMHIRYSASSETPAAIHWATSPSTQGTSHSFTANDTVQQSTFDVTSERSWSMQDFNLLEMHVNKTGAASLRVYEIWFEVSYTTHSSLSLWSTAISTTGLTAENYVYKVYANDSSGNLATISGNFTIMLPLVLINATIDNANGTPQETNIEIYDSNNTLEFNGTVTEILTSVEAGNKDLVITPTDNTVDKIELSNVTINTNLTKLVDIDDAPESGDSLQTYAIDPTAINFTNANVTVTAKGDTLQKCKDWNFENQTCEGEWITVQSITPGQQYTFTLTAEDPGFMEIILITKATHLDENRTFISDIYEEVREQDDIWSETIPANDYVRVTFEANLNSENDITIYPRTVNGTPQIKIYEENSSELIAEFSSINDNEYNKVYLTGLTGQQDTFDLKIINGSVEFDHIIDPATGSAVATLAFFMDSDGLRAANGGGSDSGGFGECPIQLNDYGNVTEKCGGWGCTAWTSTGANNVAEACTGRWDCVAWNGVTCAQYNCSNWTAGTAQTTKYCSGVFNCTSWNGSYCNNWTCTGNTETATQKDAWCSGVWNCTAVNNNSCSQWNCTAWTKNAANDKEVYCSGNWDCTVWNGSDCRQWNCTAFTTTATVDLDVYCANGWNCTAWNGDACDKWACLTPTEGTTQKDYHCRNWNCSVWDSTKKMCNTWNCTTWNSTGANSRNYYCSGVFNCTSWNSFTYDTTPPNITIQSPLNQSYNTTSVWFNITLNEPGSWCGYSLDGRANVTMTNSSGNWNNLNSSMTQSSHNVTFWCNDTAGNMNKSATVYFVVDTTAPTYSSDSDNSGGSVIDTSIVNVSVYWQDNLGLNASIFRTNKSGTWANASTCVLSGTSAWCNTTIDTTGDTGKYICWNQYANDSAGNWNTTMSQTVHCFNVTALNTAPKWSNNQSSTPNQYAAQLSLFNVTWVDDVNVSTAWFESNYSGSATNYTMFLLSGNKTNGTWSYNATIAAGTYYWKSYTNDTANAWNSTNTWIFTIAKADNPVNLYLNGTLNTNVTYTYPATVNATGTTAVGTVYVYRDNSLLVSGASPQTNISLLGNGTYAYKVNATGNANYSDNSTGITYYAFVNKADDFVNLSLNGTQNNLSINYGTAVNASSASTSGTDQIYRNGTNVTNEKNINIVLGAGYYVYKANTTGNTNYTANSTGITYYVTVAQITNNCSLILDKTTPQTYGTALTATCTCFAGGASLYRNGTDVTSTENGTATTLPAGTWDYVCNTTGNVNFTSATNSSTFVVDKAPTLTRLFLNGTENNKTYIIGDVANLTVTVNATGQTVYLDTNLSGWTLQSSTTPLTNITTLSQTGYYNITGYYNGSDNYTASTVTYYLTVSNNAPITTTPTVVPSTAYVTDNLYCNATLTDSEQTSLTAYWTWYKNGAVNLSSSTSTTNNTNANITVLLSGNLTKGDSWICKVTPNDGYLNGTAVNSTAVVIQNSIPTIGAPTINGTAPYTNDILECDNGTFSDADYDSAVWYYRWYDTGALISGQTSNTLDLSVAGLDRGNNITCSMIASDGTSNATAWQNSSNYAIIQNSAPTTPALLTPTNGLYGGTINQTIPINCSGSTDLDSDTINYTIDAYYNSAWYTLENAGDGVYSWNISSISSQVIDLRCNATDGTAQSGYYNPSNNITIDNTNPGITFVSPTEMSGHYHINSWIAANVSITESNLKNFTYYLYNSSGLVNSTTFTTYPNKINWTGLIEGNYSYNATVYDQVGQFNKTETRILIINFTMSIVAIDSPDPIVYNTTSIWFNATTNFGVYTCKYSLNGAANVTMNNDSSMHWFNLSTISENNYNATFYCNFTTDGTYYSSETTFTVDVTAPTYSSMATSPVSPTTYSLGGNYQFNITWTDATSGVNDVTFEFNGVNYTYLSSAVSKSGNTYYITLSDLAANESGYAYRWYAVDNAGKQNSTSQLTYIINKASTLTRLFLNGSEGNRTYEYGDTANFTAAVNISGSTVYLDSNLSGWVQQSGTTPLINITHLLQLGYFNITGSYPANVNYTASNITYFITVNDSVKPKVQFVSPTTNGTFSQNWIEANVTASDLNLANITIYLYNSSGLINSTVCYSNQCYVNLSSLIDGTYYLNATAYDIAGNSNNTGTNTIILDTTGPSVTFVNPTPANDTMQTYFWVYVNITANEDINTAILDWNGTNYTMSGSGTIWNYNLTGLPEGSYNYFVYSNDSLGNANISELRRVILNRAPNVTIISPLGETYSTDDYLPIIINASDNNGIYTAIAEITKPGGAKVNITLGHGQQNDSFNTNTLGTKWESEGDPLGPTQSCSTDIDSTVTGKAYTSLSGDGSPETDTFCSIISKDAIDGNFDISIEFNLTNSTLEDIALNLILVEMPTYAYSTKNLLIGLTDWSGYNKEYEIYVDDETVSEYLTWNDTGFTYRETNDLYGKFRITRVNNIFTFYTWNNTAGNWHEEPINMNAFNFSKGLYVVFNVESAASNFGSIEATWDNFTVNGGFSNVTLFGMFTDTASTGIYNVSIFANDTLGLVNNSEKSWFNLTVINHKPSAPFILTPAPFEIVSDMYNITWSNVIDRENDSMRFNITLLNPDTSYNATIASNYGDLNTNYYEWNTTAYSDGVYTLIVTVYENATVEGYTKNYTLENNFTIDNTPPTIEFTSPTEISNTTVDRSYIQVNVTVVDANLANITLNVYNSSMAVINSLTCYSSPCFANISGLTNGIYYFNATTFDLAGHTNSTETRNVTLSITIPPLPPTGGAPGGGVPPSKNITCGDKICSPSELCSTCPEDCGICPVGPEVPTEGIELFEIVNGTEKPISEIEVDVLKLEELRYKIKNSGNKSIENVTLNIIFPEETLIPEGIHRGTQIGWNLKDITGWELIGKIKEPRLTGWPSEETYIIDVLAPGEEKEVTLKTLPPITRLNEAEIVFQVLSNNKIIFEDKAKLKINSPKSIVAADYHNEDDTIDLYIAVDNRGNNELKDVYIEFNLNDGKTTRIFELHGPYVIPQDNLFLIADTYRLADDIGGKNYSLTMKVYSKITGITVSSNNFDLTEREPTPSNSIWASIITLFTQ